MRVVISLFISYFVTSVVISLLTWKETDLKPSNNDDNINVYTSQWPHGSTYESLVEGSRSGEEAEAPGEPQGDRRRRQACMRVEGGGFPDPFPLRGSGEIVPPSSTSPGVSHTSRGDVAVAPRGTVVAAHEENVRSRTLTSSWAAHTYFFSRKKIKYVKMNPL